MKKDERDEVVGRVIAVVVRATASLVWDLVYGAITKAIASPKKKDK